MVVQNAGYAGERQCHSTHCAEGSGPGFLGLRGCAGLENEGTRAATARMPSSWAICPTTGGRWTSGLQDNAATRALFPAAERGRYKTVQIEL